MTSTEWQEPWASVDVVDAWDLLGKLPLDWWPEVGRMNDGRWYCEICQGGKHPSEVGPPFRAVAETAPMAISLAMLAWTHRT